MVPIRFLFILDKRTRKETIIRYDESGPCPPLVNPPGANELKDRKGFPAPAIPPEEPKPS